jgi:hypothetical protein
MYFTTLYRAGHPERQEGDDAARIRASRKSNGQSRTFARLKG